MDKSTPRTNRGYINGAPHKSEEAITARLRKLVENSSAMITLADSEGRTFFVNQAFYTYTATSRENDDGFSWAKVIHPDDILMAREAGEAAFAENRGYTLELRCKDGQGNYRWHLLEAKPLHDDQTKSVFWASVCVDIDNLIRSRRELEQSEMRWHRLANSIPQIAFSTNAEGHVEFCNQRFMEYVGLSEEQIYAGGWKLVIHPEDLPRYMKAWQESLASGDTFEFNFRLKRVAGLGNSQYRRQLGWAVAMRAPSGEIINWFATWTETG